MSISNSNLNSNSNGQLVQSYQNGKITRNASSSLLAPNPKSYSPLYELAKKATAMAYSPYSGFSVGAALLCEDGRVYLGANIENAALSATVCAERTAFMKAVSDGERKFTAIAVAGRKSDSEDYVFCPPCGVCRQVMSEFCDSGFVILLERDSKLIGFTLNELLPESFSGKEL